jgi:phosphatidylserine decarboxylase
VKGCEVTVDELLGDRALATRFEGGAALVIRLAPADYHRFHFPDRGEAGPARSIPGPLHSVHPVARAAGVPSLRNRRAVTLVDTPRFGTLALLEIGALCVGTIVQTYAPGSVQRGQEKGLFRFGGSAMVLLAQAGRLRLDDDLLANTNRGLETVIRMGTRVGVAGGAP